MTVTIYGIRNCDTMKKARAWLEAKGVGHAFHDYKLTGIDRPRLEAWCDEANEKLSDLTSFVLPAGTRGAAALHLARTVCRRAERSAVALADAEPITPEALAYLNRLSDLLFILARAENQTAGGDVMWVPGEGR